MINLKHIQLIVSDFDGVMTDNKVLVSENGMEGIVCNRSDGLAVEYLREKKVQVLVISKEKNKVVETRCNKLGIPVYYGIDQKIDLFKKIIAESGIPFEHICYVGNEMNDYECMSHAHISIAPRDAHPEIRKIASYVTEAKGGEGVIREISNMIL